MGRNLLKFKGANLPDKLIGKSHLGSGLVKYHFSNTSETLRGAPASSVRPVEEKFERLIRELKQVALDVLKGEKISKSYSSVFKDMELVLMFKHSEQGRFADWLLLAIEDNFDPGEYEEFLEETTPFPSLGDLFVQKYREWEAKLEILLKLFTVLDRGYLLQHPRKETIIEHGLTVLLKRLMLVSEANDDLGGPSKYAESIRSEFRSKAIASIPLTGSLEMHISIAQIFRSLSLAHTNLYTQWSKDLLQNALKLIDDNHATSRVKLRENLRYISRCVDILKGAGYDELYINDFLRYVNWQFIFQDFTHLLESSFQDLVEPKHKGYLRAVVKLSDGALEEHGYNAMQSMYYVWGEHIINLVAEVIRKTRELGDLFVPRAISLWNDLRLVFESVNHADKFRYEIRNSMGKLFSLPLHNKYVLSQLSKFCDSIMKNCSSGDFQKQVDDAIVYFKLIPNKKDFFVLYERDVSKRALLGKNFNLASEEKLLSEFLSVVGEGDETMNLVAMMRDLKTSSVKYSGLHLDLCPSVELNALVLELKFWPEIPKQGSSVVLPPALTDILSEFTAKYANESEKLRLHVLDWSNYSLHQLTIKVHFNAGAKELTMTLIQASVLLLFQDDVRLMISELVSATNMEEKLVKRIISSFTSEKYPILLADGQSYMFNENFTDKLSKIRIPLGRDKETSVLDEAQRKLNRNRTSEIRAAIVRTMKQAETLEYPQLLARVTNVLTVAAPVHDLKEQIDYLITNEFLKRGSRGESLYYIP